MKENIEEIYSKVKKAAQKSGRNFSDITILGVTKTVDVDRIKIAVENGIDTLGENKVQEFLTKYDTLKNVNWHFIGHLQTNKVKYIIDKVKMIHSVDSEKLAIEINDKAEKIGIVMDILLEINVAEEDTKYGLKLHEVYNFIEKISFLSNIKVKGLMTIAPFTNDLEENRTFFEKLRKLFIDIKDKKNDNIDMKYLSMGMTNDYEIAIEEGSNIIRIGTGIFGKR